MKKDLCRDTVNGKIFGVCAGLASHWGWELWLVRIVMFSGLILVPNVVFVGYMLAWFILEPCNGKRTTVLGGETKGSEDKTESGSVPTLKETVWQAGESSSIVLNELKRSFDEIEGRIRRVEEVVTSKEFTLHREFKKL